MPLARVHCSSPQESAPLIERLRSLGYDVELAGEGQSPANRAELEIEIECCAIEHALSRAEAFARRNSDAQIIVAPGVLTCQEEQAFEYSGEVPEGGGGAPTSQFRALRKIMPVWGERARKSSAAIREAVMRAFRPDRRRRDVLPTIDRAPSATFLSPSRFTDAGLFALIRLRSLLGTRVPLVWVPLFSIIALGTWAVLPSPRPVAPLSNRMLESSGAMDQQVPFGAVVVKSRPSVTRQAASASATPPQRETKKGVDKPEPKQGRKTVIRRASYHETALTDDGDVVVRHYPRRQAQTTQARVHPKRISDTD